MLRNGNPNLGMITNFDSSDCLQENSSSSPSKPNQTDIKLI